MIVYGAKNSEHTLRSLPCDHPKPHGYYCWLGSRSAPSNTLGGVVCDNEFVEEWLVYLRLNFLRNWRGGLDHAGHLARGVARMFEATNHTAERDLRSEVTAGTSRRQIPLRRSAPITVKA